MENIFGVGEWHDRTELFLYPHIKDCIESGRNLLITNKELYVKEDLAKAGYEIRIVDVNDLDSCHLNLCDSIDGNETIVDLAYQLLPDADKETRHYFITEYAEFKDSTANQTISDFMSFLMKSAAKESGTRQYVTDICTSLQVYYLTHVEEFTSRSDIPFNWLCSHEKHVLFIGSPIKTQDDLIMQPIHTAYAMVFLRMAMDLSLERNPITFVFDENTVNTWDLINFVDACTVSKLCDFNIIGSVHDKAILKYYFSNDIERLSQNIRTEYICKPKTLASKDIRRIRKKGITNDEFISYIMQYAPGEILDPGKLHVELHRDIVNINMLLTMCERYGLVEARLQCFCPTCRKPTGPLYKQIEDVPKDVYCEYCHHKLIDPLANSKAMYKRV